MPSGGPGHQAQSPESTPAAIDEGAVAAKVENFKRAIELMKERTEREHRDRLQRRAQFKEITLDMDSRDRAAAEEKFLSRENRGLVAKCRMWTTNDFDSLRVIGEGSYGLVHLVRHRRTGSVHALKQMRKEQYTVKNRQNAFNERDCLADVNSDWIVGLHAAFQDTTYIYMLMEFVEGGDLINHLIEWKRFPEQVTVFYMAELLEALDTVHRSGFVHRDVKPENVVITGSGHLKLLDFGLCRYDTAKMEAAYSTAAVRGPRQGSRQQNAVGTPQYMAPEAFDGDADALSDIWAVGIMTFECVVGVVPFHQGGEHGLAAIKRVMQEVRRHQEILPAMFRKMKRCGLWTEELERFLKRTICESIVRIDIGHCRREPFFRNIDFGALHQMTPPIIPEVGTPEKNRNFPDIPHRPLPPPGSCPTWDKPMDWPEYRFDREAHELQRPILTLDSLNDKPKSKSRMTVTVRNNP